MVDADESIRVVKTNADSFPLGGEGPESHVLKRKYKSKSKKKSSKSDKNSAENANSSTNSAVMHQMFANTNSVSEPVMQQIPSNSNGVNNLHTLPKTHNKQVNYTAKNVTVVAGDSIIQNLQGWRLSNNDNHVVVKSFSGANITDMEDYLKPILRKEPNQIILHVGTNDLKHLPPRRVAEGIANLATQIKEDSPATSIVISSILPRSDNSELSAKAIEANKLIKAICSKNQWAIIDHSSVNLSCLNTRGLHLNRKGTSVVAKNISKYISSC